MNNLDPNKQPLDDLDRLLLARFGASADQLTPSSGFTQSVMDAVREQTTAPEPIPFPWRRFLPFAITGLCILTAFIVAALVSGSHGPAQPVSGGSAIPSFLPFLSPAAITSLGYIALAIGVSTVTTLLSLRLAMGRR